MGGEGLRLQSRRDDGACRDAHRFSASLLSRHAKVVYQIENLTNLHDIPSKVKVIALPAKWKTESAPARVMALIE